LTYTATLVVGLAAQQAGRPDLIRSPTRVLAPTWEDCSNEVGTAFILQLIAQGLSNREMSERVFLTLDTVKAGSRSIHATLQVQGRAQAVVNARSLNSLPRKNRSDTPNNTFVSRREERMAVRLIVDRASGQERF